MGTPEFSAKILAGIIDDGYNIVGVITEPDKPVGRKQEVLPTPVKELAQEKGLAVFQPQNKKELLATSYQLPSDLIIVAAYGKILPKEVLESPKYGCINFHGSLLPKLRGASPIQSAILHGLAKTGATIMVMDEGMDTGPIISQVDIPLDGKETTTTLRGKMLEYGLPLLIQTIPGFIDGELKPTAQNNDEATYSNRIEKEDGHIDFSKSAEEEERKLRAFNEWPGAFGFWGDKRIKILQVEIPRLNLGVIPEVQPRDQLRDGAIFLDNENNLCITFAKGYWVLKKLQIEGGKEVDAKSFLNGHSDFVGAVLA